MSTFVNMIVPVVWAAGGGDAHSSSIVDLIFPLINFLIFAYLVKRYAIPPLKEHLRKRREGIINSVAKANEAKNQAEKYLQRYRSLLQNLQEETAKIREGLRAEGEREKVRMMAEAEEFATKLKADADFMAEQEIKMARQQIRRELADLAEEAAERAIVRHLTGDDQNRLINDFAQHVGNEPC
jgi:F-type H+-transporting ATPase subunit b